MKNQSTWASPELRAKLNHKTWKQAGVALAAAASFLLVPSLTPQAQAQAVANVFTTAPIYLGNELNAAGISTAVSNASTTQTNIQNALKAILGETSNNNATSNATSDPDFVYSNPGLFVSYILTQRNGSASAVNDAAAFAPALVAAGIQGLQQSVYASSTNANAYNPVTKDNFVSISGSAALIAVPAVVAAQATVTKLVPHSTYVQNATYKTQAAADAANAAKNATSLATAQAKIDGAVETEISSIAAKAVSTALPSDATPVQLARAVYDNLSAITYTGAKLDNDSNPAPTVHLPYDQLAKLAGEIVGKLAPTQQGAAADSLARAWAGDSNVHYATVTGTNVTTYAAALLKTMPVTASGSAFAVIQTTAPDGTWTSGPGVVTASGTDGLTNTQTLFKKVLDTSKIAAITYDIFSGNHAVTFDQLATLPIKVVTTSGTVANIAQADRSTILAGLAAGAAKADASNAGTYVTAALTHEYAFANGASGNDPWASTNNASATQKSNLIKAVAGQLAGSGSAAMASALTAFTVSGNLTNSYTTPLSLRTLASDVVKAVVAGAPDATATDSLQGAVAPLVALAGSAITDKASMLIQMVGTTNVPGTTYKYATVLQTIASTAQKAWSVNAVDLAVAAAGSGSSLTATIKGQVAAGIIKASPLNAVAISSSIASQYNSGSTAVTNIKTIAAAVVSAAPDQLTDIVNPIIGMVDLYGSGTGDADRKAFATALAAANPTLSGNIASLLVVSSTEVGAHFSDVTDARVAAADIAVGVIAANPLGKDGFDTVAATVQAVMPARAVTLTSTDVSAQVLFSKKLIAGAATSAVISVAKKIGAIVQSQGTDLRTFVTTVQAGSSAATDTLFANAQIANIAAGFAQNGDPFAALSAVLKVGSTNSGAVVGAIVANTSPTNAVALTGSAAGIIAKTVTSGTGTSKTATAAQLGALGNGVALVLSGNSAADRIESIVKTSLLPNLDDFHTLSKPLPLVSISSAAKAVTAWKTAWADYNTQATLRINDLAVIAGSMVQGLTDPALIAKVITATTTGTLTGIAMTGTIAGNNTPVNADIVLNTGTGLFAGLVTTATTAAGAGNYSGSINPLGLNQGLVNYGVKVGASFTTKSAVPFYQTYLMTESGTLGLSSQSTLANFASSLINGVNAKASDIAQGTALFAGNTISNWTALSPLLAARVAPAARANTAAGLAQVVANFGVASLVAARVSTSGTIGSTILPVADAGAAIGTIAGDFASARVNDNSVGKQDADIIAIAKTVAMVNPIYAWNVAKNVVGKFTSTSSRETLASTLITAISAKLTGPTAVERIGLLVAAIVAGNSPGEKLTGTDSIVRVLFAAIKAKTSAAYDIFGSVVAAAGLNSTETTALRDAMAKTSSYWGSQWSTASDGTKTTVANAVTQAAAEIAGSGVTPVTGSGTAHFFTPSTGDMTGQETSVTNR